MVSFVAQLSLTSSLLYTYIQWTYTVQVMIWNLIRLCLISSPKLHRIANHQSITFLFFIIQDPLYNPSMVTKHPTDRQQQMLESLRQMRQVCQDCVNLSIILGFWLVSDSTMAIKGKSVNISGHHLAVFRRLCRILRKRWIHRIWVIFLAPYEKTFCLKMILIAK